MNPRLLLGAFAAAVVLPLVTVQACGPDFYGDIFVYTLHPDAPKDFVAGKLAILQPTFPRADLAIAYRYLAGGTLDAHEQSAYTPLYSEAEPDPADSAIPVQSPAPVSPADQWLHARAAYAPAIENIETSRELKGKQSDGSYFSPDYLNCHDDAFRTATLTLAARAKAWGGNSPALKDWLAGQDSVFSNCHGGDLVLPAPAPAGSPTLLLEDRAYQSAAAHFYAADFKNARTAFEAIGRDTASPWHSLGLYLAARSLVRQAFLTPTSQGMDNTPAVFDAAKMREAQTLLASLLPSPPPGLSRETIQKQLDFVRLRTEPEVRLRELAAAVAGPDHDPGYTQHLADLTWALNVRLDSLALRADPDFEQRNPDAFENDYKTLHDLRATAPLIDWLVTFQSPAPAAGAHALAEWQRTASLPWLVAALSKATGSEPAAPKLIEAAAGLKPDSPAWLTATYHRIRLLALTGRLPEARAVLAAAQPQIQHAGPSAVNLFARLRMRSASTLDEALAQAVRPVLQRESEQQSSLDECVEIRKNPKRQYDCTEDKTSAALAPDAARWMNRSAPLSTLAAAAKSPVLPQPARQSVAIMTWTRAVLLNDTATAAAVFPLLPQKLQSQAGAGTGFKPLLTLVRNPGLRPYLDPGVQRAQSFDFVESFGDNWWCSNWRRQYDTRQPDASLDLVPFLSPAEQKAGEAQAARLLARGDADADLGAQVVAYVDAHPADPDAPEALYLVLRMIRYGCDRSWDVPDSAPAPANSIKEIKARAARLLRRRYPTSAWTKKAAPIAG